MAKRMPSDGERRHEPEPETGPPSTCNVCGGRVAPEPEAQAQGRKLQRVVCLRCGAEFGTTGPAMRYF